MNSRKEAVPPLLRKAAKTVAESEGTDAAMYDVEPWPWPDSDLKRAIFPVRDADGRFVGKEEVELRPVHLLDACFEMGIRHSKKTIYVRWIEREQPRPLAGVRFR